MQRIAPLLFLFLAACASAPPSRPAQTYPVSSAGWDIANIDHWRVDYHVNRFKNEQRDEVRGYLERKREYETIIADELRRRRLPQELIYLAMIESGFNTAAHSAAEARGIWQLTAPTARQYGLRVDETVDERLDPQKSTTAALNFLTDLHERFGSWYLAMAAYNTGGARVAEIMRDATGNERGTDEDYYRIWDRLPGETRDFVPAMIAAARIGKEPAVHGFAVTP